MVTSDATIEGGTIRIDADARQIWTRCLFEGVSFQLGPGVSGPKLAMIGCGFTGCQFDPPASEWVARGIVDEIMDGDMFITTSERLGITESDQSYAPNGGGPMTRVK